jgi:hypothetical protein
VLSLLWGRVLLFLSLAVCGFAQPAITHLQEHLDLDGNGTTEFVRNLEIIKTGEMPEDWSGGNTVEPWGNSRLLRANSQRISLALGQAVDISLRIYSHKLPVTPPQEVFGLTLIDYRALSFDGGQTWQYQTLTPAFENETEVLLGLKLALADGAHYGWLKLGRSVADLHTPFEIRGHAYHPVAGEAIGAGEPPPPPPLRSAVVAEDGTLSFSWDPAWGAVLLEWTDNLAVPDWQLVPDGTVPPVTQLPTEAQRFYRLRRP